MPRSPASSARSTRRDGEGSHARQRSKSRGFVFEKSVTQAYMREYRNQVRCLSPASILLSLRVSASVSKSRRPGHTTTTNILKRTSTHPRLAARDRPCVVHPLTSSLHWSASMMKTRRQSRPEAELLEERALLSAVAHTHHVHPARAVPTPSAHLVTNTSPLLGSVSGAYNTKSSSGVVGRDLTLSGSGGITSLGTVQLTGVVHLGISRASALPTGTLILSDSQGTIRLSLKGNGGPLPLALRPVSANSMQMRYTIVSGTGAYRSLHGSGSLALSLGPDTPPTVPPTSPPSPITGGPGSSNAGGGSGSSGGSSTGTGTGPAPRPCPPPPCRRSRSRGEGARGRSYLLRVCRRSLHRAPARPGRAVPAITAMRSAR